MLGQDTPSKDTAPTPTGCRAEMESVISPSVPEVMEPVLCGPKTCTPKVGSDIDQHNLPQVRQDLSVSRDLSDLGTTYTSTSQDGSTPLLSLIHI